MKRTTNEEKIILKNLPSNFKYIARNKGIKNDLYIFEMKPKLNSDGFFNHYSHQMPFNQHRHIFKAIEPGKCYRINDLIGGSRARGRIEHLTEMLEVELYEEFRLEDLPTLYRVTEAELQRYSTNVGWIKAYENVNNLLSLEVIKQQQAWRPKFGECYYVPAVDMEDNLVECTWSDALEDYIRFDRGLVFKTEEEAVEMAKKILKAID